MSVFQDTWKLDIDTGFISVLGDAEAQLSDLDKSFEGVTAEAERANKEFAKTEREAAKAAKAMEREAAKAARELARDLAKAEREAAKAGKALDREAAKGALILARAMAKAEREAAKTAKTLKRDAVKAAKATETAMNKAARAADREAAALIKTRLAAKALKLDNTRKGVEGLSSSLGVAAINGETLSNGWLAAGVAAGTLVISIGNLIGKGLTAYTKKNKEAADATTRFDAANKRLLESLGAALFAEEKGVKALDSFAGRMDNLAVSVKKNKDEIRNFAEGVVNATGALVKFATFGVQAALAPVTILTDILRAAVGVVLDFGLGVIETVTLVLQTIGLLPDALAKDIIGVTDGVQKNIKEMTDITEGWTVRVHRSAKGVREFTDDMTGAATGTKDFSGKLQKSEKDLQEFTGPVKNWVDDDTGGKFAKSVGKITDSFKELQSVMNIDTVISVGEAFKKERERIEAVLAEFDIGAKEAGFGDDFGLQRKGFGSLGKKLTDPGADGLTGAIKDAPKKIKDSRIDISSEVGDFGASGIALATDQLRTFFETMADGTLTAAEFGKGILTSVGSWVGDFGEAMIIAGTMAQFVQSGQLLIAPAAAIGLGLAAVTLGGLMSGIGGRGGGRASASSSADASARRTQRTLSNDRSSAEDRDDAAIIIMMDRAKVGEAVRADGQQASRRGQFNAGHSLRGLR